MLEHILCIPGGDGIIVFRADDTQGGAFDIEIGLVTGQPDAD